MFKESGIDFPSQTRVNIEAFHLQERMRLVKNPAVQTLQPVQQSLGEMPEIRLTETEFLAVDPGQQRLPVDTSVHQLLQLFVNDGKEAVLVTGIGIFRNNGKDRLLA